MANKALFPSVRGALAQPADTRNEAGGLAYQMPAKHALAQLVATGTIGNTYYASGEEQLVLVADLAKQVEPLYLAQAAIYARAKANMKDTPALLLAFLSRRDPALFRAAFTRVVDSVKMLRNFVQIMRSGVVGRRSFGTAPRAMMRAWLASRSSEALFRQSVGNDPSLADIVKLVRPRPEGAEKCAFYGWLLGRPVTTDGITRTKEEGKIRHAYYAPDLPELVKAFEAWKAAPTEAPVPPLDFQMLAREGLTPAEWRLIFLAQGWQALRMNINTALRHGVLDDPTMVEWYAAKLRDEEAIRKAKAFPYQLFVAHQYADAAPEPIKAALRRACHVAGANVPAFPPKTVICPDLSGSMNAPVTGKQGRRQESKVTCRDVAGLFAATVALRQPLARVLPFADSVLPLKPQATPFESVFEAANWIMAAGGGGTNCSAPLKWLNQHRESPDLVIYLSDNESWVDTTRYAASYHATAMMTEWEALKLRHPTAKLVCVDLAPNKTVQAYDRGDILNIGGFGDEVWRLIALFLDGKLGAQHWVSEIETIAL